MKKIIFLIGILAGCFLAGCNDFLDIKPKGYTIPQNYDDYVLLMNGTPLFVTSDPMMNYLTDNILLGHRDSLEEIALDSKNEAIRNLYCFKPGAIYLAGKPDRFWESSYANIFTYNVVINNVMKAPDANEALKLRLRGEALIGRAMEFLNLVNGYATHYNATSAKTDLGIPLVMNEDINVVYKRNSVEEVYKQIEKDILEAIPTLPAKDPKGFRSSQAVGEAFLARVYLYMGIYDKALIHAKEALKVHNTLLDQKKYISVEGGWDHIVNGEGNLFPINGENPEDFYFRLDYTDMSGNICGSQDLINSYKHNLPNGATDQRLALFFFKDRVKTWKEMVFPGKYLWAAYHVQNVGFAVPEMMLIAAECEARVGTKENAMGYINMLRDSRIINNQLLTAGDKEEALRIVLDERRREMPFTGLTRLIDLKRLNLDERFRKTITHTANGETWTLPANDSRYLMPIPPRVLERNPTIPQYER